jgi:class 3 adenylate cyclase
MHGITAHASFLLFALLLLGSGAHALQRPSTIKFGMYHNMVDSILLFDGTQMYAGAQAAVKEINDADLLDGITLAVDHVPTATLTSAPAVITSTALNFTNDPQYFGSLLADWGSSATLSNVGKTFQNATYPVIASRQLSDAAFYADSRFDVSLRQPPTTEFLLMLHHAMNTEEARCTSFAVMTRSFFNVSTINSTLAQYGFPSMLIDLGANFFALPNATNVLGQWNAGTAGTGFYPPQCGLFFTTVGDAQFLLEAMYSDTRFDMPRMTFYAAGLTSEGKWNSSVLGTAPYARMHFVTNFPYPHSTVNPLAIRFRAALGDYLATVNMSAVPAAMQQLPFLSVPSLPAMEGYLAVRWVATVLASMPSINRTLFLDKVYSQRFFWVDDVTIGPLTDRCLVDSSTDLSCFCNAGLSTLRISPVDTATGFPTLDDSDATLSTLSFPLNVCFLRAADLRTPLSFEMWYPQVTTAAGIATFTNFKAMMALMSASYNAALTTPRVMFSATLMNPLMPIHANESNAAYQQRVYMQRRPVITFGDLWLEGVTVPVINVIAMPYTLFEDLPLGAPTQYSRFSWMLKPTLGDLVHGIALKLVERYTIGARRGATPVIIAASDAALGASLITRSVNTVQWPVSGGGVLNLTDGAVVRAELGAAMARAARGEDVVFFVASLTTSVVVDVVAAAATLSQGYEGTATAASVWSHFVLAIATDQNNVYRAKYTMTNTSALPYFPVLFGSYLYAFWEPANAQRLRAAALLNSTSSAVLESIAYHAGMTLFDLFSRTVQSVTAQFPTATDILNQIYETSLTTANGVVIGPIYDANCSADVIAANEVNRKCQCFKILRTINVHDFRDFAMNTANHNPQFQWTMSTCGVAYSPLVVPTTLNVGMIAGIAAPLGAAACGLAIYFACFFGRRSNRTAPKEAAEPFAMVFTDIQSSTSLWARAPEAMGEALEQHHALLRRLVDRHDGYEVKTIGDSFMVAFKRARDAAEFGLAIQTVLFGAAWSPEIDDVYVALAQEAHEELLLNEDPKKAAERRAREGGARLHQWEDEVNYPLNWNGIRVRVGMHWGVGSVKFDAVSQGYDYYGTLVNTAARVEGVGNGGQVLATMDMYSRLEAEGFDFSSVDLVPMGPQPLRGLDQPVPLFQLCPLSLRGREFAALRLDVEVDLDDSTTDQATAHNDTGTHNSALVDESPELLMARLLRRQKDSGPMMDYLQRVVHFMETLLRTSPLSWRKETVKTLLKKWHVHARKPREKEAAELTLLFDLTALVARAGLAAEEARKASHTSKGGDTATDATSSVAHSRVQLTRRRSTHGSTRVEDV